jgi:serine/threonine protein kinase/tetratricopeptide (TPR) repeat protein
VAIWSGVGTSADGNRTLWNVGPAPVPVPRSRPGSDPSAPAVDDPGTPIDSRITRHDPIAASPPTKQERFAEGETIPGTRYRVVRFIGDGGMGAVYEAAHLDLERRVAAKILQPRLCRAPEALEMFRAEARTASKVGSDQIVELYDFAELPDGRLMFTMELLHGPTLSEVLRTDGPLSPSRLIAILRQLCKGLAAAHAAGIVHRDIKPDNIVLVQGRKGRADTVKILDFGIATILEDGAGSAPMSVGTPHYLAPELIAGTKFDHRVDVYSVGCTAYELLTGRPPFVPRDGKGLIDILDQHVNEEPVRPSALRPGANIPDRLEATVMRCLAKQPAQRFRNMDALEAALCVAQVEAQLTTSWDDLPLPERIDPRLRDHLLRDMPDPSAPHPRAGRWAWPVVTALSLVLGAGAMYWMLGRDDGEAAAAVSEADGEIARIESEARTAASRNDFVVPTSEDPSAPTAYSKVRELEKLGQPDAEARAIELRHEFAETLVHLGDSYWERDQGQSFAVDYYRQALVFEKDNARAAERASLSAEELATFERKAEAIDFTTEEIEAAEELVVLAEPEPRERQRKLEKLSKRRTAAGKGPTDEKATERLLAVGAQPADDGTEEDEEEEEEEERPKPPPADPGAATSAADLVASARKLVKSGNRHDAELFYKRALTYDPHNVGALEGMYELEFGRGKWGAAGEHAEKLVVAAPSGANYLRLGDVKMKLGALESARDAYARASSLGSGRAASRLAAVEAKLGPKPDEAAPSPTADEAEAPAPEE